MPQGAFIFGAFARPTRKAAGKPIAQLQADALSWLMSFLV